METGIPGQLDLTIESLRDQDTGVYSCTAVYAGNQKLVANVTVESFSEYCFFCAVYIPLGYFEAL